MSQECTGSASPASSPASLRARPRAPRALVAVLCVALACLTASAARSARADGPAADKAAAQEMFSAAMDLRAHGDLQAALVKFRLAHRLGNTPTTALELGRTLAALGKLVEAREILESVTHIERSPRESKIGVAARAESAKLAEQVKVRTPTLLVRLVGTAAARAQVDVDGVPLASDKIGVSQSVDPGAHHLSARDNAAIAAADIKLEEGESRTVTLTVDAPRAEPANVVPAPAPAPLPTPPRPAEPAHTSTLVYIGFATTGVAAVVGSVFGVLSFDKVSTLKNECHQHVCTPAQQSDIDSARATGAISTVAFAVAGVALAATVTALLWPSSGSAKTEALLAAPFRGVEGRF